MIQDFIILFSRGKLVVSVGRLENWLQHLKLFKNMA